MKFKKEKKKFIVLSGISLLTVIGSTLAYFVTSTDVDNNFMSGLYTNEIVEKFVAPTNWTPGTKTKKEISLKNTGSVSMAVRAKINESWTSRNGNALSLTNENGEKVSIIEFGSDKWKLKNDGYYYYVNNDLSLYELKSEEITTNFINSVTFNENTKADLVKNVSKDGNTITYSSSGNGYDNATYTLTVTLDTIQYDQAENVWLS